MMTGYQAVKAKVSHAKKWRLCAAMVVAGWLDVRAMETCSSGVIFFYFSILEDFSHADE